MLPLWFRQSFLSNSWTNLIWERNISPKVILQVQLSPDLTTNVTTHWGHVSTVSFPDPAITVYTPYHDMLRQTDGMTDWLHVSETSLFPCSFVPYYSHPKRKNEKFQDLYFILPAPVSWGGEAPCLYSVPVLIRQSWYVKLRNRPGSPPNSTWM